MIEKKVFLFAKDKPGTSDAVRYINDNFQDVSVFIGTLNDPFPAEAYNSNADIVISYISPWIIPVQVLNNTREYAINFHPGPPQYPGIGCTNFALYDNAETFGVTAHIMEEKVDTGEIINVRRFNVATSDTVLSLTEQCYENISIQFKEVIQMYITSGRFEFSNEKWTKKPYTRKELNDLCILTLDMTESEMRRRIRATDYPGMPGAYIIINGIKFNYA